MWIKAPFLPGEIRPQQNPEAKSLFLTLNWVHSAWRGAARKSRHTIHWAGLQTTGGRPEAGWGGWWRGWANSLCTLPDTRHPPCKPRWWQSNSWKESGERPLDLRPREWRWWLWWEGQAYGSRSWVRLRSGWVEAARSPGRTDKLRVSVATRAQSNGGSQGLEFRSVWFSVKWLSKCLLLPETVVKGLGSISSTPGPRRHAVCWAWRSVSILSRTVRLIHTFVTHLCCGGSEGHRAHTRRKFTHLCTSAGQAAAGVDSFLVHNSIKWNNRTPCFVSLVCTLKV